MEKDKYSNALGEERLTKLMIKYSVPCILSLLVTALYNIVDQIFIGNSDLSTLGNAATAAAFPFFIIAQAFAWSIGDGCATYISICQGKKEMDNVPKAVGTSCIASIASSVLLIAVFLPLKESLLTLFGASENTLDMAVEYIDIIIMFLPMFLLSNVLMGIIRTDASPTYAMLAQLLGAVVNIILDPVFIFGLKWGMTGAALATVIGQVASFIMSAVYFIKPKTFKLNAKSFIPSFSAFREPIKFGVPTFVTQITILIVTVLCNITLVKYGAVSRYGVDIPIAVIGIVNKVVVVLINIVVGIVLGCQPIISYNMGAKNYDRVKEVYKRAIIFTIVVCIAFTFLFELAPEVIIRMFGTPTNVPNPDDYWHFAKLSFRVYLMLITCFCVSKVNAIFFQAVGKPSYATITTMLRDIFCFLPLMFIICYFVGIEGVLIASPISDFLAFLISVIFLVKFMKQIKEQKV